MLAYLSGKITYKCPTHIYVETGGMGFMLKISLNTYEQIAPLEQCRLHTSLVVRNEGQNLSGFDLYGFFDEAEKDLFEKLISVSGVGAATARMMLSGFKPEEIRMAILTENESMIQSVKGIGPKMAKRLILELKDKMGKINSSGAILTNTQNTVKEDALSALVALGFNRQLADKALARLGAQGNGQSVEMVIKEALKIL